MMSSVRNLDLHSVMAAPLIVKDDLFGVVYADNRLIAGAFNQHKLDLLGVFAGHVSVALSNARLFQDLSETRAELAVGERMKTIGQVAAFVAHKVKNPLSSIRLLADMMEDKWDDPGFKARILQALPEDVSRLDAAINEILDYSRPTPMIKVSLRVQNLLESALRSLGPELESRGIRVEMDIDPSLPAVLADGERLREVFVNLLKNAGEAVADREEQRVTVRAWRTAEGGEEIVVEDSGPGIPEENLETIFEPFRTSKTTGSGLGLALCQKVVREHGGKIRAENAPEGGARFRVTLPIGGF
jgi:signal transduction histidine kinase